MRDEATFLDWAAKYADMLKRSEERGEDPARSPTLKDCNVCNSILILMDRGEEVGKYTCAQLRFLFGAAP